MRLVDLIAQYTRLKLELSIYELLLVGDVENGPRRQTEFRFGADGVRVLDQVLAEIDKKCLQPLRDEMIRLEQMQIGEKNDNEKTESDKATTPETPTPRRRKRSPEGQGGSSPRRGRPRSVVSNRQTRGQGGPA